MQSTINQVRELGERVNILSGRVASLEKDSAFMTDASEDHAALLLDSKQNSAEELAQINENIELMQTVLKNVRIELDIIIGKLKDSVRKHEMDSINERVEQWAPEKFATKLDLKEYED